MKVKNVMILLGTAVVLGGAAALLNGGSKPSAPRLAGKPVAPAFNAADVARIEVGDKVKLVAGDAGWTLESLYGYPADREKIAENVLKLQELKVGQVARGRKLGQATPVVLKDAAGKELAKVVLGDAHQRKGAGEMALYGGYPDGRYLAFEGETVLVKDTLDAFDGDPKKWCSTRIASLTASDVASVAFAHGAEKVEVSRGTNTTWTLKGLTDKEELDTSKTYSLDSALSYLDFTSVVDPKLTAAELGFATGWTYTVTLKNGTNHVARVGNAVKGGTDRYFRLDDGKWTFTISSYAAESMMKQRKDLVKEKPVEKKPEPKVEAPKPAPAPAPAAKVEKKPEVKGAK